MKKIEVKVPSVYLDVQAYNLFFHMAGSRLHGFNVDGIIKRE